MLTSHTLGAEGILNRRTNVIYGNLPNRSLSVEHNNLSHIGLYLVFTFLSNYISASPHFALLPVHPLKNNLCTSAESAVKTAVKKRPLRILSLPRYSLFGAHNFEAMWGRELSCEMIRIWLSLRYEKFAQKDFLYAGGGSGGFLLRERTGAGGCP